MSAARSSRSGRGGRTADPLAWRRAEPAALMLLRGPEDYAARWVTDRVVASLTARHGALETHRFRAADYRPGQLAQAASPSLFAEPTLIRVDGLESMNDAFLEDALHLVQQGPGAEDVTVVLRHTGGNRGKRLLDAVARAGTVVECPALKRDEDRLAFVQAEFRDARRRIDDDAARALVNATGTSLTDLAAACSQLLGDVDGPVTADHVQTYYGGRVEATSFAVADAALEGQAARAVSLVRHALATGVHPVMVTSVLALKARQVARIVDSGMGQGEIASALGIAPFQVRFVQQAARHWSPEGIARAVEWIAQADAEVKGASRNPDFAVERAVIRVATAVRR
ncbi:DNA polymerase III subunit delta [Micrococcus sp.]|uniref:DNA polymerase III subunit delta n=1 Tax=Micrococcus sp. TaxID=1271 RepID=UPI002A9105C2|nr:DNA polymerase III subunit delta [Micrococcus sp.]MDY6055446.1 DNA polymerase III subunit delta [Micrococcus sp.]